MWKFISLDELFEVVENYGFKIDIQLHSVILAPQPNQFVEVSYLFCVANALLDSMVVRKVHVRRAFLGGLCLVWSGKFFFVDLHLLDLW